MLGVVAGSSLLESNLFSGLTKKVVDTKFGQVLLYVSEPGQSSRFSHQIVFCQRHHADPDVPYSQPHLINKRAIAQAFATLGVKAVVGFGSVGGLKLSFPPGTLCVCADYVNFWSIVALNTDASAHIVPGYHENLRKQLINLLTGAGETVNQQAVYVQTIGPRFETPAEIRILGNFGDVVGMTGADEATLFKEAGLPYASVCMVDNFGNGIVDLTYADFKSGVAANLATVERVATLIVKGVDLAQF